MSRLSSADRDRIIQLLTDDQPLPNSDRELLFPATKKSSGKSSDFYSQDVVPPENWLCFSLYSTSLAVSKAYWPSLEKFSLTYPQLLALRQIQDGITVNELGSLLYLDSGTMTPLLKRLEAAGHIRRERDPKDERRVRLYITEQGKQIRDEAVGEIGKVLPHNSGWPRRDIRQLAEQISNFRSALLHDGDEKQNDVS